ARRSATTIRPSGSRCAPTICENWYSSGPSTTPISSDGSAATRQPSSARHAGAVLSTITTPALSRTAYVGAVSAAPQPAAAPAASATSTTAVARADAPALEAPSRPPGCSLIAASVHGHR